MTILKMKAYGDWEPYDINIGAGDNERIHVICDVLNDFCSKLPGCEQDVKISIYLDELEYSNVLINRLVHSKQFDPDQAQAFVDKLTAECRGPSVYVYPDTFSYEDVDMI